MRSSYVLLIPLVIALILATTPESSAEIGVPWRSTKELPGYPYQDQDPWNWKNLARLIGTDSLMDYGEHRRGMRALVNFYVVEGGCDDSDALRVYRTYMEDAIAYLTAYRDWFVENYPQFSYLKKLKFQISNGTVEKALNIPIEITKGCIGGTSVTEVLRRIWLRNPATAFHEFVHALGAGEICVISWEGGLPKRCDTPYYQFYTLWVG
jgi:hypothetical protein